MHRFYILLALIAVTACSSSKNSGAADEYIVDCNNADGGQGFASDENYVKFVEAESANRVSADPCKSPELIAPATSIRLDVRTPPTFSFRATHASCGLNRTSAPVYGCLPRKAERSLWSKLVNGAVALLEGTAEAHCGAFSGENYFFRFK